MKNVACAVLFLSSTTLRGLTFVTVACPSPVLILSQHFFVIVGDILENKHRSYLNLKYFTIKPFILQNSMLHLSSKHMFLDNY